MRGLLGFLGRALIKVGPGRSGLGVAFVMPTFIFTLLILSLVQGFVCCVLTGVLLTG